MPDNLPFVARWWKTARFTDNARAAVRAAFGWQSCVPEHHVLLALAGQPRSVAPLLLARAGIDLGQVRPGGVAVARDTLIEGAVTEARRRRVNYVGCEHLLLAVARLPDSALARLGATAERLDALLSEVEAAGRAARAPLARRLGAACRSAWRWLGDRS